jgi:hypothetical protein
LLRYRRRSPSAALACTFNLHDPTPTMGGAVSPGGNRRAEDSADRSD